MDAGAGAEAEAGDGLSTSDGMVVVEGTAAQAPVIRMAAALAVAMSRVRMF